MPDSNKGQACAQTPVTVIGTVNNFRQAERETKPVTGPASMSFRDLYEGKPYAVSDLCADLLG